MALREKYDLHMDVENTSLSKTKKKTTSLSESNRNTRLKYSSISESQNIEGRVKENRIR